MWHLLESLCDGLRRPCPRREKSEGVKDLLIQSGGLGERVMTPVDSPGEALTRTRVKSNHVLQVAHPEGDVPRFILRGESGDLPCDGVGRMLLKKPGQVQERSFTEDR